MSHQQDLCTCFFIVVTVKLSVPLRNKNLLDFNYKDCIYQIFASPSITAEPLAIPTSARRGLTSLHSLLLWSKGIHMIDTARIAALGPMKRRRYKLPRPFGRCEPAQSSLSALVNTGKRGKGKRLMDHKSILSCKRLLGGSISTRLLLVYGTVTWTPVTGGPILFFALEDSTHLCIIWTANRFSMGTM